MNAINTSKVIARFLQLFQDSSVHPRGFLDALHDMNPTHELDELCEQDVAEAILQPILGLIASNPIVAITSQRHIYCSLDDSEIQNSLGHENMSLMTLPIVDDKDVSITDMIGKEMLRSKLDGYKPKKETVVGCPNGPFFEETEFRFGSDVMVLQIRRTNHKGKRVNTPIHINKKLKLGDARWDLTSLIEHKGNHYINYTRVYDRWHKFDDNKVREETPKLKHSKTAVCMVYTRRGHNGGINNRGSSGFPNIGNTCWMNAGLQLLFSMPSVVHALSVLLFETITKLSAEELLELMDEPIDVIGMSIKKMIRKRDRSLYKRWKASRPGVITLSKKKHIKVIENKNNRIRIRKEKGLHVV